MYNNNFRNQKEQILLKTNEIHLSKNFYVVKTMCEKTTYISKVYFTLLIIKLTHFIQCKSLLYYCFIELKFENLKLKLFTYSCQFFPFSDLDLCIQLRNFIYCN